MNEGCVRECPGCAHRDWSLKESSAQKMGWLSTRLSDWKNQIESLRVSDQILNYRNKTCLRAEWDPSTQKWKLGLRVQNGISAQGKRLYEVISIPNCPIHSESIRRVIQGLISVLPSHFPLVFVTVSGKLATLVLKSPKSPKFWEELPGFSEIFCREKGWDPSSLGLDGVWGNLNPAAGERVFSNRGWHLILGQERSQFSLELEPGQFFSFEYGPDSFQQLIPNLYLQALDEVSRFFKLCSEDRVVDLCSGIGISLKKWQLSSAQTLGVELNGEAVKNAWKNAGTESCLQGRSSERIPQIQDWLNSSSKIKTGRRFVFVNPPRLGIEPEVTQWLSHSFRPDAIAYLSCSAGTLARDLSILCNSGYRVNRIIPYDFFPQTSHVETLTLLERVS